MLLERKVPVQETFPGDSTVFSKSCACYNHLINPPAFSEHLSSILVDFPGIHLVYLFGSQVTGEVGPMSDTDLGLVLEPGQDELAAQSRFQFAVSKRFNLERVDVILLDKAPIQLAYHVIASGRLLFQKSLSHRVAFEAKVLGLYGDYLPTLRMFQQQILQGDPHGKRVQRYREALGRTERTLGQIRAASQSSPEG